MILLIDNYDSFSYNLFQMVGALYPDMHVVRNDACPVSQIEAMHPEAVILSPGPGRPADAGVCEEAIRRLQGKIPILGVCLGHQAICEAYGAVISYARELMHGKQSDITIETGSILFEGIGERTPVGRYHSLSVKEDTLPDGLKITARTDDGEVMAVEDTRHKVFGVQFHPESIMTPEGEKMLKNFLTAAGISYRV